MTVEELPEEPQRQRRITDRGQRIARLRTALIRGGASGVEMPEVDGYPVVTEPLPGTVRTTYVDRHKRRQTIDVSLDE
jgi:hypothetical protein